MSSAPLGFGALVLGITLALAAGGCHWIAPYGQAGTRDGAGGDGPAAVDVSTSDGGAVDGALDAGVSDGGAADLPQSLLPATAPVQRSAIVYLNASSVYAGLARDVAIDVRGRSYAVGYADSTIPLPGGSAVETTGVDGVLIALDQEGELRWARLLSSVYHEEITHVAVSRGGELLAVAGFYVNEKDFAGVQLPDQGQGQGARSIFVALLDAETGDARWFDRCDAAIETTYNEKPLALEVDDEGRLALGLGYSGELICDSFGSHLSTGYGNVSALLRYQCNATTGSCHALSPPLDLASTTHDMASPIALALGEQQRLHIATRSKLNAIDWQSATEVHTHDFFTSTAESLSLIALSARGGRVALAAQYYGSYQPDFGAGPLANHDTALALYDGETGALRFVRGLGNRGTTLWPQAVDLDDQGAVVVASTYLSGLAIGDPGEALDGRIGYVAAFDEGAHEPRWSMLVQDEQGVAGGVRLWAMAFGGGRLILGGRLEASMTLAGSPRDPGANDAFMALTLAPPP